MIPKKGQISTEYLILISFITFIVLTILGVATFYTSKVQDTVKFDEIEKSAKKIVYAAETTFYSGAPAKSTIEVYFPGGITDVEISENHLIFRVSSGSGENVIAYPSSVPIEGTISPNEGLKIIRVTAEDDGIIISE